jgi:TRAP-type C4-dicarboxylate transport system substrate-binding protein
MWPLQSSLVQRAFIPVLEDIKKKSNGRITYTMFANSVLGAPANQYDIGQTGKADLVCDFGHQYTPSRWPLSELLGVPVPYTNYASGSETALAVFDRILHQEYKDTKTFLVYIVPIFHYVGNKKVLTLSDFKGLKIRTSGRFMSEAVQALGGSAVAMPTQDLYLALQTGVVDGAISGRPTVVMFKVQEVIKYYMDGFSFCGAVLGVCMNLDTWNKKIPDDLKPMVEQEIRRMGYLCTQINDIDLNSQDKIVRSAGVEVYTASPAEAKRWYEILTPVVKGWVAELEAKGLPAQKVMDIYREECNKRGIRFPY